MKKWTLLLVILLACKISTAQFLIQASGPIDVCYPASVTLSVVSPQAGYMYTWFIGGYGCPGSGSSSPYNSGTTLQALITGEFYCMGTPTAGGSPQISNPITVRVLPGMPGSIYMPAPGLYSGNYTCVSSASLCIPAIYYQNWPGTIIKWYKNNVLISGASSGSYTATSEGYYKYTITSGCVTALSDSTHVTTPTTATISAGGATTFCAGNSVTLSANTGAGLTYQWKNNGATIPGATSSSYTATATGNYTCVVSYSGACSTSSNTITVTVNSLPSAIITPAGSTTICNGSNVVLNANTGSGLTYQWKLNGTVIPGATSSSNAAAISGSYTVLVTNISSCTATSSPVVVTVNTVPGIPSSISGSASVCPAQSGNIYSVTADPAATSYFWTLPAGASGSSSTNSITVNFSGFAEGTICVQAINSCGGSAQACMPIAVVAPPAMPSAISGNTAPCANSNGIIYSCPAVSGAVSYTWTVPATATLVSGQGTTSVTVNFGPSFTSGAISVTADNCAGSSVPKTKNVYGIPATPGAITGQKTGVCAGTSNVPYSIASVGGASTYTWTAPANATIVSGQGTVAIAVNFGATFTSGTLSVTAGNACGTSAAKTATINSKPPVPGTITGPITFCANQQGVAYSVSAVNGATTYNWLVPTGATVATGQGTNSITVNFGNKSGKVKVNAANGCGASNYKQLTVTKNCREGLSEQEGDFAVHVYPNPSSGDFTFEINNAQHENISVSVYDMVGKLVFSESIQHSTFNIDNSKLEAGVYTALITVGENKKAVRIVKIL